VLNKRGTAGVKYPNIDASRHWITIHGERKDSDKLSYIYYKKWLQILLLQGALPLPNLFRNSRKRALSIKTLLLHVFF